MDTETKEHIHTDDLEWLKEVTYWHNELLYYDNVLLRLLENTNDPKLIDGIEEFKSRFDEMQEAFNQLKADIDIHEKAIDGDGEPSDESDYMNYHEEMRSKIM